MLVTDNQKGNADIQGLDGKTQLISNVIWNYIILSMHLYLGRKVAGR